MTRPKAWRPEDPVLTWLEVGLSNPWIVCANDPPFDRDSFRRCDTALEMARLMRHGNWCVGSAFWWEDVCCINQVVGGDEFLTIKQGTPFESLSACLIEEARLAEMIEDAHAATPEQCRAFEYEGAARASG